MALKIPIKIEVPVSVGETALEFYNSDGFEYNNGFHVKEESNKSSNQSDKGFFPELSDDDEKTETETDDEEEREGENGGKNQTKKQGRCINRLYERIPGSEDDWRCRTCSFQTDSYHRIRYHVKTAHRENSGEKSYACSICSKKLSTPTSLHTHMKLHKSTEKNYACSKCGWSFRMKHHLDRHQLLIHDKGNEPKRRPDDPDAIDCYICKTKVSKLYEKQHLKRVHGIRKAAPTPTDSEPIDCTECGKKLKNAAALKVHLAKMHHVFSSWKEFKYNCDLCQKAFVTKSELCYHRMRHTGQFPFICEKCGAGMPTSSELRKHQKNSKRCNDGVPTAKAMEEQMERLLNSETL